MTPKTGTSGPCCQQVSGRSVCFGSKAVKWGLVLQVASWKGLVHSVRSGRHYSAGQLERLSTGPSSRRAWKSAVPCWQS